MIYSHPFPKQSLVFICMQWKSFENTVKKGEIARNEQFLLFPQCFLPVSRTFCHFHWIWNCRLQSLSVWKSEKFVIWERVINCKYIQIDFPDLKLFMVTLYQLKLWIQRNWIHLQTTRLMFILKYFNLSSIRIYNIVVKGENADHHHFLLSTNVFKRHLLQVC